MTPIEHFVSIKSTNRRKAEQVPFKVITEDNELAVNQSTQASSQIIANDLGCDDDKGKIMEEAMKTYIKQQEKLHSILQKKQHLQMV